jgi:hypothetical protein
MSESLPCAHKKLFTSMKVAIEESRKLSRIYDTNQTAYHCTFCKNYHLTTQKSEKAKKHKWRKRS